MAITRMTAKSYLAKYVKGKKKAPAHIEDTLQMQCVLMFRRTYASIADHLHHSPNGGRRSEREGARFKRMGVLPGIPDLQLLLARGGFFGLYIELKAPKGTHSDNQRHMQGVLLNAGYLVREARSVEECLRIIGQYLALPPTLSQMTNMDAVRMLPVDRTKVGA